MQVKPRFRDEGVEKIVDPALGDTYDKEILKVMTEVALMCAAFSKNDRPSMKVLSVNHHILNWNNLLRMGPCFHTCWDHEVHILEKEMVARAPKSLVDLCG